MRMDALKSMEPCDLIVLAVLLTFLAADDLNASGMNVLGNFIVTVGSLLLTWAAQKQALEEMENTSGGNSKTDGTEDLREQLRCLRERCGRLEHGFRV